ncbi:hypothetical protein J437_LFUL005322 [Ladona fulva]|uniref:Uncharacterized protein n=1 Tax=Ladona fulva TaxID=123851 RepID=A0A8K0JYL3_LADFU|nr:hypothetical protein J437_LFUL005322 [Ladona fulva]
MSETGLIKCVVVGDGTVGKTCLLISYTQNRFPTDYVPTIFDNYSADIIIDGLSYKIGLFDTAGEDDYVRLRPFSYPGTDVFLACFAVDSMVSFENIRLKWIPELRSNSSGVPILLVGNKSDLRTKPVSLVSKQAAENLVKELHLYKYSECSALTQQGVKDVFDLAITAALTARSSQKRHSSKCSLL